MCPPPLGRGEDALRLIVKTPNSSVAYDLIQATAQAALSLRGDAETDTPAAAEPQAGEEEWVAGDCAICGQPERNCLYYNRCPYRVSDYATPAPASTPAVGGEALEGALDDLQRVSRRLRGRDITAKIAADLLESIRSRIVLATRRPPPRADAAADDVAALQNLTYAVKVMRDNYAVQATFADYEVAPHLREFVRRIDNALASTQRKDSQ